MALTMLVAPPLRADPPSAPGETAEGVFGEGTTGHGQPDSKTGAMNWTYPFILPAARGGPQPELTLRYNSSSRDREAGYGWGLDLPVIERKPLSGNPCFKPDGAPIACWAAHLANPPAGEERYTYSGQPLVFICQLPGSRGGNGSDCGDEPQPAWAGGGWRYFRLQVEGQFSRFYLSEDRRYWRVQLKGGGLLEFGEPPNRGVLGIEHALGNKNAVLRWRLVRHSDAVHLASGEPVNYIDYRWKRLGKRGLLYLTDIYDTPRANGPSGSADFAHHTQLAWGVPDFPQTFYADPYRATPDLRLIRVAVASMPWSGSGPREVIRTYVLGYAPAQGATSTAPLSQVFQLWHHSFLSEIAMEGRCQQFEDERGNIPVNRECPQPRLPATTFEYEDGFPNFGIASITKVQGGPPNAVDENRVLPYVKSVGVVDFNRDGLPDIVQSWDTEFCPGEGEDEDAIHESIKVSPNQDFLECQYKTEVGLQLRNFHSTRPITGYLNRGLNSLNVNLDYQCMDAGKFDDPTGLTHFNPSRPPGFLSGAGGVTLLSSWSEGVVAWSNAQYAPYRARPLLPGAKAGEFEPGTGCDPDHFKEPDFHPGWKWEKTQVNVDWAKLSSLDPDGSQPDPPSTVPRDGGFPKRATRFFADIDGDGLVDRLVGNGLQAFEFEAAYVEFTGLFARNEPLPGGGRGPAQIPFTWNFDEPTSLAPGPRQWTRGDTRFYYVDINGDGLVDLVTYNPDDSGGAPRVRPGDGHGHFVCETSQQPWPCQEWRTEPSSAYEVAATGSRRPWPFNEETFFHDVTGDGLADIVQYDMASGEVRLWVNQDGHTFACVTGSCVAGKVLDQRTATFDLGDHRTTFADMNADGIDDIVILAKQGVYVGTFMKKYIPVQGFERGAAPRPGLLTRIHNGYGATTDIRYDTIQGLDQAVRETAFAWRYHSPVVENVVTQIVTQDSYHAGGNLNEPPVSAPYQFKRKARYLYQNPAYDRWSRSFAGFRKVVARYGDEQATTAATYWFGPCQNNGLDARLATAPDLPLCLKGSDDEDQKSLTGRVVRIDRGNDFLAAFPLEPNDFAHQPPISEGPKLLWTRTFGYSSSVLFDRPDRRVSFSYPGQIDTYLYDDAQPTKPGGEILSQTGGDSLENPPHQKGIRKHLSRQVEYDGRGTQRRITDRGAIKDEDRPADKSDATTITLFSSHDPSGSQALSAPLPCTRDWQCLPDYISIWEPQPTRTGNDPDKLLRKSHFTYTATHDIRSVEGWLDIAAKPLERHHPAGAGGMAPEPPGQSLGRGWHTFATLSYDTWNNLVQTVGGQSPGGSPPRCTTIVYDTPYQHLPSIVSDFKDGCSGSALATRNVFDRGFEQVVSSVSPSGGASEIRYDPFGRPIELYSPDPGAAAGTQKPVLAATLAYSDRKPASYVDVRRIVGPGASTRSVTLLNSLGETIVAFDQGNNNDWVLNGWRETNLAGQLTLVRRPWTFTADPIVTADKASFITVPSDNSFFEVRYDGFGRKASIKESGAGFSLESMRTSYFPLAVETRDAEQLKPGGIHAKAFRRMELDGYGRSARVIEQIKNPAADTIVSTVKYDPMGKPVTITRTHAGSTYQRTMEFDTLGRLMVNREPNTGNNWHYVWDDAGRLVGTSDARGCGANFYHDGLGRLIGEDYSPCLTAQAAYTSPNLATGEGLEAFYRYDTYEADQVSPEPNFPDDPRFAQGNLVSISDRGSHTRFNYDARGRVRRIAR